MHSNNDTMDPNYKPSELSAFESFMNTKKTEHLNSHSEFYSTVHVTNWAQEYVSSLETKLQKAIQGLKESTEHLHGCAKLAENRGTQRVLIPQIIRNKELIKELESTT